jgi:hypothetical protein
MFNLLPVEILIEILAHVPSRDLKRAAQVCRSWRAIVPPDQSIYVFIKEANKESCQLFTSKNSTTEHGGVSAWKRRAELYFSAWIPLLPPGHDYRWLCSACDNFVTDSERVIFSGLGRTIDVKRRVQENDVEGFITYEYVGEILNGKFEGVGILRSTDQDFDFYVGTWKNGLEHGFGKFSWKPQGRTFYVGSCKNGQRDGYGEYHWDETRNYVGFHKANQLWGSGTFTCKSALIDGEWRSNKQHGACTILWPPKEPSWKFIGQYRHGLRVGVGTYFWADGATYTGEWYGLHRQGWGKMEFANGLVWEGNYERDLRHGDGTLTWTDTGDCFKGTWFHGGRRGSGVFTDGKTGEKTQQHWNENSRIEYAIGASRHPPSQSVQG